MHRGAAACRSGKAIAGYLDAVESRSAEPQRRGAGRSWTRSARPRWGSKSAARRRGTTAAMRGWSPKGSRPARSASPPASSTSPAAIPRPKRSSRSRASGRGTGGALRELTCATRRAACWTPCARRSESARKPACACRSRITRRRGKRIWGRVRESLELIEEARARGIDVTADQYPYTSGARAGAVMQNGALQSQGRARRIARVAPERVLFASAPKHPE